jgi:inner membrane protease subunit 1
MTTTFFRRFAEETRRSIGSMTRLAIVIAAVKTHVADLTLCVGPSMMPTFNPSGDVVVVDRTRAGRRPRRGDVVLATSPTNPTQLVFKRAVGVGGDEVEVPFSRGRNHRLVRRRVRVPPGSVWLQGDNAMNSTDSRDYGAVPEQMILGRALVRVWPPSGFGAVENSMGDCALADEARTAG